MYLDEVRQILIDVLNLGEQGCALSAGSPLLGALPELDSMAVVSLITALEEQFDIAVADDEIDTATFETLGSLARFVEGKLA